ncbi:ABC transporter permease [Oscillibacter valericigenes]|nr:ABC transporter permease [Oscillibacter valericigenes]
MRRHNFTYFFHEGVVNLFSHGFMSFAAIGITVACLLVMGTFSLVAYNVNEQLRQLESENEVLAFVDETLTEAEGRALQPAVEAVENVRSVRFITREEACETFEEKYEGKYALGDLDAGILRDRFAIKVNDISRMEETRNAVKKVAGIADARADENLAEGFVALRNVASVVCIALIAILLVVSIFIISNTIKLTTFDRRDEIAIMKMVGATNGFIRWPFVYEGFIIGLLSAGISFGLQWLLYATVARSIAVSDVLRIFSVVDFVTIWKPVALVFGGAGMLVGVGGSLTAIRKFLQV